MSDKTLAHPIVSLQVSDKSFEVDAQCQGETQSMQNM